MINNDYVCELNLDLDYAVLKNLALTSFASGGLRSHQRRVNDYDYLKSLRSKYTVLGDLWNVYRFQPNTGLGTHIDWSRKTTLNIPLEGTEESITRFYKFPEKFKILPREEQALFHFNMAGEFEEVFNFSLLKPSLVKTDIPHSVLASKVPRLIISWSIPELTFEEARSYFKSVGMC